MDTSETLRLTIALADRADRAASAARLAAHVGADAIYALIEDPELHVMVPAPGLAQTLPGGGAWRDFLRACATPGVHRTQLPPAPSQPPQRAVAYAAPGLALVFVGDALDETKACHATPVLAAVGSALRAEQDIVVAVGALRAAQEGIRNAQALARALDEARTDLEAKARSLIEARGRAEDAARAKDEFLAMLGHELRNPLAPIVTALHLMRLRGSDSREQDIIERHVSHLTRLVDDLLDVSRITQGKIELRCELIEIAQVVSRAIEMASPLLEQRRQQLDVLVPPAGLTVDADPQRLAQVLTNLLTNASRYSGIESRITLRGERDGDEVRISVRDRGIGIEPEMLQRIFETFVQDRRSADDAQRGLGLGLAIVRSLVQLHDGTVQALSNGTGHGSEFVVTLPAHQVVEAGGNSGAPAPENLPPGATARTGRVLVVDDNADGADMLKLVLRTLGYDVRTAPDGPTALAVARDFRPTIALLDIGLPVMDGFELAERLIAMSGNERPRLVAITGYGQDTDRARSKAAGFHAHLVKPVDFGALERLLDALSAQDRTDTIDGTVSLF